MKRVVISGFLSLIGSLWCLAGLLGAAKNMQNVTSWHTPPGRFGTALLQSGMIWPAALGGLLMLLGLLTLGIEYFRRDK